MKNNRTIKVHKRSVFDIEINGTKFKGFEKTNEWKDFFEFTAPNGLRMIACLKDETPDFLHSPFLGNLLGMPDINEDSATEYVVIKASPEIIEAITDNPDQEPTTTESGET